MRYRGPQDFAELTRVGDTEPWLAGEQQTALKTTGIDANTLIDWFVPDLLLGQYLIRVVIRLGMLEHFVKIRASSAAK